MIFKFYIYVASNLLLYNTLAGEKKGFDIFDEIVSTLKRFVGRHLVIKADLLFISLQELWKMHLLRHGGRRTTFNHLKF